MKIWISLPADFTDLKYVERYRGGTFSTAATCPPRTLEMQQDNIEWFEVDVLRKMKTSVVRPGWGYYDGRAA